MASSEPPANSPRAQGAAALALTLAMATCAPAHAQSSTSSCCPSAAERLARQAALERLRAAREAQVNTEAAKGPVALPVPTEAQRRRAFEGLRNRKDFPEINARAHEAHAKAQAVMATQREAMARRIGEALGLEPPDIQAIAGSAAPPADKAWVPVLFASSSMPTVTLRNYAAQLERARGVIAFRGMPGGLTKVAPMAKLTAEILRLDPGCEGPACAMRDVQVLVDPLLFRQHGVTRVPALTMVPGDPAQPYCERDDGSPRGSHLVLGDAALSGLFEEYARLGGKAEVSDAAARLQGR